MDTWAHSGVTGDPGRVHTEGRITRAALEDGRERIATLFGVRPLQVILTSGGTESINSAVWGATRRSPGPVICAAIEHSAARDSSARLADIVSPVVDGFGTLHLQAVDEAIEQCRSEYGLLPSLVHCQWANHEVGTVQPVNDIVSRCRELGVLSHVDAVAAAGYLRVDVGALDADLVSVSSHKLGGPPGIGALIVRRGLRIDPYLVGGEQERARRAGLENLPAAIGFGAVAEVLAAPGRMDIEASNARRHAARLVKAISGVDGVTIFGDPERHLPHIVCAGIDGVEAEPVLLGLDQAGIAVHSGSSCSSESLEPSPVLEAMGVDAERSLRLSVGWSTVDADIDAFADAFPNVVAGLRALRS